MKEFNEAAAEMIRLRTQESHIIDVDAGVSQAQDTNLRHPLSGVLVGAGGANGTVLVPSVTPLELNTSATSNGKKMVAISVPIGVDALEFRIAVAAAYMQYIAEGTVTFAGISERSKLSENRAALILTTPEFKTACTIRGMVLTGSTGMSVEQDYALQIILDPSDGLTFGRKLAKAGISNSKWQAWLKNPLIKQHYQRVSEGLLADSTPAILGLVGRVAEGDLAAIKFQLELNNRYNPNKQNQIDVLTIMNRIMEVLAIHVTDRDELIAIASKMKEIGEAAGLTAHRTIEG